MNNRLHIGLDVGSTTVKKVIMNEGRAICVNFTLLYKYTFPFFN